MLGEVKVVLMVACFLIIEGKLCDQVYRELNLY